ncbi:MAG: cytochrome P460 family protein [Alphaproteobacteria bacterium]
MLASFPAFSQTASDTFGTTVSEDGAIQVPDNYQKNMVFIGTWGIKGGEEDKIAGFHNVFTSQDVVEYFKKTGEFPDGAVLVKELMAATSGRKSTGDIAWAGEVEGWFVMVKDGTGRFPGNPLWGNGWGWSYFAADDPKNTLSTNFRSDCLGCHIPAKKTDWIYMEGYSILKKEE